MKLFGPLIAIAFVSLITPAFAEINIDVVVDGLNNPWEMVFAPNGDIYFSERDGRVWKIENFGEAKVIQTFPKSDHMREERLVLHYIQILKRIRKFTFINQI